MGLLSTEIGEQSWLEEKDQELKLRTCSTKFQVEVTRRQLVF